jgi:hypothetical protein
MTPCTLLSDRILDVVAGRARWTAEEEHHLAVCPDCRAELDLVNAAAHLADGYRPPAASVTAAAGLERLRTDRSRHDGRRVAWVTAVVAAAAVVALVVWTGAGRGSPVRPVSPPGIAVVAAPASRPAPAASAAPADSADGFPLPELDSLSTEALDSMLRVLDEPLARAAAWELPDIGDAGDQLLEHAITGREG